MSKGEHSTTSILSRLSRAGKGEQAFAALVLRHADLIGFVAFTLLGVFVRVSLRNFVSGDFVYSLGPWYDKMAANGGLLGLRHPIENCDYTVAYQTYIAIATALPLPSLFAYKMLSCFFDVVLALACARLVTLLMDDERRVAVLTYGLVFMLPTVVTNSAAWAQCDSIWTAFCVLSLCAYFEGRYGHTFAFLGLAFAFKLQAVFIVPFYLFEYFRSQRFSARNLLYTAVFFLLPAVPALLLGRPLSSVFAPFAMQTGEYLYMVLNYPNFWMTIGMDSTNEMASIFSYESLRVYSIGLTIALLGLVMLPLWRRRSDSKVAAFASCCLFVFIEVMFLPSMHERYGYLLEILLVVMAFVDWHYLPIAFVAVWSSLIVYSDFLFHTDRPPAMLGWANVIACAAAGYLLWRRLREPNQPRGEHGADEDAGAAKVAGVTEDAGEAN